MEVDLNAMLLIYVAQNVGSLQQTRALVVGKCAGHLWRPIIVASSINVQVTGETLAAKSHNQIMQNVTRKNLFDN